jgi:uncharacterized damage-inducible protein DinB
MTRQEFITAAEIAFEKLMTPTRGIPPTRMEEPMKAGGWSLMDLAAHFIYWNTLVIRAMEQLNQGLPADREGFDSPDEPNSHAVERQRSAPLKRVMTELRLTHSTITEAVRRVPDEQLLVDGEIPDWLLEHVVEHYARHTPQVEAWAESIKVESHPQK